MNKVMIASMREQLRPSEAARTALLERVGEIPNKREGNSVRKYFAVAAPCFSAPIRRTMF